jgi:hypothetical protein
MPQKIKINMPMSKLNYLWCCLAAVTKASPADFSARPIIFQTYAAACCSHPLQCFALASSHKWLIVTLDRRSLYSVVQATI